MFSTLIAISEDIRFLCNLWLDFSPCYYRDKISDAYCTIKKQLYQAYLLVKWKLEFAVSHKEY